MRNMCLSLITILFFFVAGALAQTSTPGSSTPDQGTTSASPAAQPSGSAQQQSPMSENPRAGQSSDSQYGSKGNTGMKGEKKMKGCIRSENGQYMLEEKGGKTVPLSGQDVSAHVGHEVVVHGMWSGSSSDMSKSSSGGSMASAFNVTSVDMVSESCGKTESSMK